MPAGAAPNTLPLRVAVGVGIVAGCTLALQVLLSRLFASVLFYHFAFLAISLALLGAGAAAIVVYVRPNWFEHAAIESVLARWCAAFAALLLVVPALLVRLGYPPPLDVTAEFVVKLAVASALSALPFFAAGIVIALAIKHYIGSVGRLYGFDLAGAGLGAIGVVPLLWIIDPPTLIVALGFLAGGASALFGWSFELNRRRAYALAVVGVVLAGLSATTSLYHLPPPNFSPEETDQLADRWSPIGRVVGYGPLGTSETPESTALITYNLDLAPVPAYRRGEPAQDWRQLGLGPQSIGYELTGPGRALIIGGGGGRDIHNALSSRQSQVDVIELNRTIRTVVDEDLASISGSPYSLPGVSTAIGDGRSTLAARDDDYDQIHIGFTNTFSGSTASSFALTENNLYTLEAFDEYLDHLRPGGVLNVSRPYFLSGEEALRATVLTLEALRRRGVSDPERHVVVVLGNGVSGPFGTILARLEPFTGAELGNVRRLADERGLGVAYAPGGPYTLEWAQLAESPSPREFCAGYRVDVCPPSDDKPFFFNMTRLGDLGSTPQSSRLARTPFVVLLITLGVLAALCAIGIVGPLFLVRAGDRPPIASLLFFAAIGLGFLTLEIVFIQRFVLFLGFPTYALSVVLSSLLIFTGLGSVLSSRWRSPRRGLLIALSIAAALIGASALGLQDLLRALIDLPFAARVAITALLLAPFGLTLGMAMPIGLARLSALHPTAVPWAWGVNAIASVLASVLAIAVAITQGFTAATVLALACYLGALAHAALGRWPGGAAEQGR